VHEATVERHNWPGLLCAAAQFRENRPHRSGYLPQKKLGSLNEDQKNKNLAKSRSDAVNKTRESCRNQLLV